MATTQTFTSSTTYAIPSDAANVTYIIHGGKGAVGGPCNTRVNRSSGGAGARGQKISGTLTGVAGSTLTLTMGGNGSGVGGNRDTGGNGAGGYWNGGRGGNNNSSDSSNGWNAGGGGGGGGATAIRIGGTVLAGAGGGGGGACICFSTNGAADNGQTSSDINTSGGSNGAAGQNSGGAWNGGGGGAGGGFPGGTTGLFAPGYAYVSGNDGSGFGGAGGAGLYNPSYHNSASTLETSSSNSSFVTISYEDQIVTEDFDWTTRSPQLDNIIGSQGSDPNNQWTTFLTNTNVGGYEPEGTTVTRSIEWKVDFNNTGRQIFNTAVDDDADVYIDNVLQFSLNTYNANTSLTTADIISAGEHTIRIEHVNNGGPYGVAMDWTGYIPPVPPTVSLTATDYSTPPNNITSIYKGQSLRLTYSATGEGITSNTFTATANGVVTNPIPSVGNSGVYFPAPTVTTTYTYTATNPYGTSTTSVTVTVLNDLPVVSLTSNDANNTILRGESVILTWSATANVAISSTTMTGVANPGLNGSVTVSPTTTTTYTFRATNPSGTTTTTIIIVVNILAPTVSLSSDDPDDTIIVGDSVILTWAASGFDITNTTMTGVTNPGNLGSVAVSPTTTTTYTFTATNSTGTSTASRTITVPVKPQIVVTANASSIVSGQSVNINWNTTGDANVVNWTSGTPGITNNSINGTATVSPTNSTQYCAIASGPGGISDTQCVAINVTPPPGPATDSNTTYTSDATVIIPSYAINVTADIAAASGGKGGTDANGSAGSGGSGRRALLTFNDYTARTFTLRIGFIGGSGFGCVANSGAGSRGSSNVATGGFGGRSGPQGCSGGGGGGGGATAVYDSVKNGYVAIAGGGGGGGGASWNRNATNGGAGTGMFTGNINSISGGSTGSSCPTDGGGGGGGGGGASGGSGGAFGLDNNYGGRGGNGGRSAYDSSYCSFTNNTGTSNFGNGFVIVKWNIGAPTIDSFTINPSPIIAGEKATLTWTSTNSLFGSINNGVNAVNVPNGSIDVYPPDDRTYTLTVTGYGGLTDTATVSIVVYIPPVIIISTNKIEMMLGSVANLSWVTTGDADNIVWVSGGITNSNLSSNSNVSPTTTTSYAAYVSGLGGTSDVSSVSVVVYYFPTVEVDYPTNILYGQQGNIEVTTRYATESVTITPTYTYDFVGSTTASAANLSVNDSAESTGIENTDIYTTTIPYDDRGPLSVTYVVRATGKLGTFQEEVITIPIIIDDTPDNLNIPESVDLIKDQQPIYTPPDVEVLTDLLLIDDVDIKVEVKSDYPIQIDLNQQNEWYDIRQIGTPPYVQGSSVGGNSLPTESGVYLIKPNSDPVSIDEEFNVKSSNITAVDFAKLVTCVSVIDETNNSYYNNQSNLNNVWAGSAIIGGAVNNRRGFRTAFPYRTFYILDPQASGQGGIDVPTAYPADPNAIGPIRVNRDEGNAGNRSDWFAICNFGSLPYGTIVSIWIDISGSMRLSTVQASYNYFLTRCANAGIEIVLSLSAAGERYIEGHIVYLPPSANFTVNNTTNIVTIIQGQSVTLDWVAFGDLNTLNIAPGVLSNATTFSNFVSSAVVFPQSNTTYLLTATGPAGSTTRQVTVNVLIPPTLQISANKTTIIVGTCANISWGYTGDASTITWTTGTITNGNLTSSSQVCPTDTTTYCAFLDGVAGQSPVTCITINVKQIPTASLTVPNEVDYGNNFNIQYNTQYANTSISITPTYTYLNGTTTTGTSINRTPATGAELGDPDSQTKANGTVPITVPWSNFGPSQISFSIDVVGEGGTANDVKLTTVNIDQTPDNLNIPDSDELLKAQEPVFSPEGDILSELILIDDIDVDIEIKANYPIKVDTNQENDYKDVRQL